jgi:hypothetical protein
MMNERNRREAELISLQAQLAQAKSSAEVHEVRPFFLLPKPGRAP